ncbi:uncharacterized protein [Musca autumnalis]|uniref:uncharacterized protein n=1 Tax=Musca autumnalis TaxID=221902 RepID=UPI003CEB73E7
MITRSKSGNRKRIRPEIFDLNRSTYIEEKKKKDKITVNMTEPTNSVLNDAQFRDLSQTIITDFMQGATGVPNTQQPQSAHVGSTAVRPPIAESNQSKLKNKLETVENEVMQIKNTLNDLTKAIQNLAMNKGPQVSATVPVNGNNIRQETTGNGVPMRQEGASGGQQVPQNPFPGIPDGQRRDQNITRINKLGLVFDGSRGLGVEEFVYRLEYFQWQYKIPWSEVIRDFPLLVTGPAESWYWLFQKTHKYHDWEELKHGLLGQYKSSRSNFEILTDLVQRKQQQNESVDTYFHLMGQLRAKLVQPIMEFDMIKIMKKNVKEHIAKIVYPIQVSSVEQLRVECNEAEKNFPRRVANGLTQPPRQYRQVNEIFADPSEYLPGENSSEEIAAIQYDRNPKTNSSCWNCHKLGHTFWNCESTVRSLFCYRCGNPGTPTPSCQSCKQGNRNKGVETAGGPRPAENPQNTI